MGFWAEIEDYTRVRQKIQILSADTVEIYDDTPVKPKIEILTVDTDEVEIELDFGPHKTRNFVAVSPQSDLYQRLTSNKQTLEIDVTKNKLNQGDIELIN